MELETLIFDSIIDQVEVIFRRTFVIKKGIPTYFKHLILQLRHVCEQNEVEE